MSARLKVMLVAGEASGDNLGAGLARALKRRLGDDGVTFVGLGGTKMAAEGVVSPFDIAELSILGLFEMVAAAPRVLWRVRQIVRMALAEQPDVVVLIDSWGFTVRVAEWLKRRAPDLPLVKYVAPQVWAHNPGRAKSLARAVDHLLTIHAFEPAYFEAAGLSTTFVGNSVLGWDISGADPAALRAEIGAGPGDPILLVLPGSRPSEVDRMMTPFEAAAELLHQDRPNLHVVVIAADTVADAVKARVAGWRRRAHVIEGDAGKLNAMAAATVAIACSGTVTTELAIVGCPMVIAYRLGPMTHFLAKFLLRTPYVALINIAAQAFIAPELIQDHCNGPELAREAALLLDDAPRRAAQVAAQHAAIDTLGRGGPDPSEKAAEAVLKVVAERRSLRPSG